MNDENLVTLSPREARENGSKGGKASVIARRQKKLLRELANAYGRSEASEDFKQLLREAGIDEADCTKDMEIVAALYERAAKGDVAAFNAIRDIKGEKPTEEVAANIPNSIRVEIVGDNGLDFPSSEEEIDGERDPRYMIHRE